MKCLYAGFIASFLLIGCGGGGGSGDSSGAGSSSSTPASGPTVNVSLDTPTVLQTQVSVGDSAQLSVGGIWSASAVPANSIYLQLRDKAGYLATPAVISGAVGTHFNFSLIKDAVSTGTYEGTIEVRACKDSACTTLFPGIAGTLNYRIVVEAVGEWETFQRSATHTAYVPITLDATRFTKIWEWTRPMSGEPIGGINAVVTGAKKVFITTDVYFGLTSLHALNETDGSQVWQRSFGPMPALSPPAYKDGKVFAATTGSTDTYLWAFDAATGTYLYKSPFDGQWPHALAPTILDKHVYVGAGYYGGYTYSFSTEDGAREWAHNAGGAWDMFTPAADNNRVYHHNGHSLFVVNATDGITISSITDPFGSGSGSSYHGAPVLGGRHNVFSFAGEAFSGRASSNAEQYEQRVFSSFDIAALRYEWSTSYAYLTAPAIANGVIYAARNSPASLDAIDEATGQILWSWTPPLGAGDTSFHRNAVVTKNLLFISTDRSVYAIDLATRNSVWRYPEPGTLAISPDRTLFIATGATASDGRLVAVRLR